MPGSRKQVWDGTASRTSGGLKKSDLKLVKGKVVSRKVSRIIAARNKKKKSYMSVQGKKKKTKKTEKHAGYGISFK